MLPWGTGPKTSPGLALSCLWTTPVHGNLKSSLHPTPSLWEDRPDSMQTPLSITPGLPRQLIILCFCVLESQRSQAPRSLCLLIWLRLNRHWSHWKLTFPPFPQQGKERGWIRAVSMKLFSFCSFFGPSLLDGSSSLVFSFPPFAYFSEQAVLKLSLVSDIASILGYAKNFWCSTRLMFRCRFVSTLQTSKWDGWIAGVGQ